MKKIELFTDRLIIREYNKIDMTSFVAVTSQAEIRATTYGIPENYTRSYAKNWFRLIKTNIKNGLSYEFGMFLKEDGEYVGNVGLINVSKLHNHADISYYTDKKFHCMGLTTEAAQAMLELGFKTFGFEKISGMCMRINPASRRVMEKIGMSFEGTLRHELYKDGIYYDIDVLSVLRTDYFTNCKCGNCESFQHQKVESVN